MYVLCMHMYACIYVCNIALDLHFYLQPVTLLTGCSVVNCGTLQATSDKLPPSSVPSVSAVLSVLSVSCPQIT